ncbi:MAG TPA: DUF4129 domain-containing protein [Planctomycetaceae bacterium]|nr:DUF4129 domain-containing protein [Planctomycetaceae bacterium]
MNLSLRISVKVLLWIVPALFVTTPLSGEERLPVQDLRQSARRILAEPEFRHFEHFADDAFRKGDAVPSPPESTTAPTPGGDSANKGTSAESSSHTGESTANEPWWRRALNRSQPSKSGNNSDSSRNQRLTPPGSSRSDDKSSTNAEQPASDSASGNTNNLGDSSGANDNRGTSNSDVNTEAGSDRAGQTTTPSTERPTRTPIDRPERNTRASTPSRRGSDGVERPVRQASRTPRTPKADPGGPTWNGPSLAFGNLLGGLFHAVAYLILAIIVVAILVLIAQAVMQAWNDRPRNAAGLSQGIIGPLTHDRSPGETEADVFVQEALALARQGEFRAAIGRLVLGGMSDIERRQWIRYRRGLTVHDYLRVLRSRPEQFTGFRQVVRVFEPVEYGRKPATQPLFDAALQGYRHGFQNASTATDEASS